MKIIGSEDYYDYVANIYGVDNNVVLDRREGLKVKPPSRLLYDDKLFKGRQISICFCGTEYFGVQMVSGKCYWGDEILKLGTPVKSRKTWSGKRTPATVKVPYRNTYYKNKQTVENAYLLYESRPTDANDIEKCPILYKSAFRSSSRFWDDYYTDDEYLAFPNRLQDLGFSSVVDPDTAFKTIYSWVLNRKEDKDFDVLSDNEKVEAKGFDKKASFRHR